MSDFTLIRDISIGLRRYIYSKLASWADAEGFTDELANIVLGPPESTNESAKLLSLYLYHVESDYPVSRNPNNLPQQQYDQGRPPLALELYYLVTPMSDTEETNQLIIGQLLKLINDIPVIRNTMLADLGFSTTNGLRLTQEILSLEQMTGLWRALNQPLRLSTVIRVSAIAPDDSLALKVPSSGASTDIDETLITDEETSNQS